MTIHDFWLALVLGLAPYGMYFGPLGFTDIGPTRPKLREGERVLGWISEHLWWLLAMNGIMWASGGLLAEHDQVPAAVVIFALSLPIVAALGFCGLTAVYRYIVERGKEAGRRRRRSSTQTPR